MVKEYARRAALVLVLSLVGTLACGQVIVTPSNGVAVIDIGTCGQGGASPNPSCTFKMTLTANVTIAFNNVFGGANVNLFINPSTFTVTWPASVTPTPTLTASQNNLISLRYDGSSNTWTGIGGGGGGGGGGVNAQTANYTLVSGDSGKFVTFSGSYLIATLPATPPSATWLARIENLGSSVVQVNRNGLNINGKAFNVTVPSGKTITVSTDGTNYFATSACPPGVICPYDWGAMFDARWTGDGVTTSSSPIVTSATIAFTAQDQTLGRNVFVIRPSGPNTLAVSTIVSVDSATQIHASNNGTVSVGSEAIAVCTDDTAAIRASFAAAVSANEKFWMPGGSWCVSSVPISVSGSPSIPNQLYDVEGSGIVSYAVMMPNFNFTSPVNCTGSLNGCIVNINPTATYAYPDFIHQTSRVGSFGVTALGWIVSSSPQALVLCSQPGCNIHDVQFTGFSGSGTMVVASSETSLYNVQMQNLDVSGANGGGGSNLTGILSSGNNIEIRSPIINATGGFGIDIAGGRDIHIYGGLVLASGANAGAPRAGIYVNTSATRVAVDGLETNANAANETCIAVDGTSDVTITNTKCTSSIASGTGLNIASGGKMYVKNFTNALSNGATGVNNAGSLFDIAGNTLGLYTGAGTLIADGHSIKAVCTGTATSSSTLALISTGTSLTGTALTTACTGTTLDKGLVINGARTLQNLSCTSSATTVSVACTVMTSHNGAAFAASTITCTMTAATSCIDGTHTLVVADGDLVTVQIVTGAAETGANIKALVEWN